ncbi:uncharacterized protein LOC121678033 [Alosa sapidissima]|uniref:uncharacterized protein LOC121678033 n=1 Tax=Alosa sapidissima TaxID=34773 RepID=UPI001C091CFF|nr:uncharacterized protein LOC121678033 [Alosa sapidissima]
MWIIWRTFLCRSVTLASSGQRFQSTTIVHASQQKTVQHKRILHHQSQPMTWMTKTVGFSQAYISPVFGSFCLPSQIFLTLPRTIKLAVHHQLLLVLMRLRLGLMFTDLGKRFGISRTTACEIFAVWRPILARFMKEKIIAWLPKDTLERIRPQSFSVHYPKATFIIDCTEIFVQRPKNLRKRAQTYSNYNHHNTYKALYCIAPNDFVMFVSKLFGGRASDTFITRNSGLISHLIPGDQVLADRGFTITDVLPPGVTLAIPAFTRGCKELPEHEVTRTRRLANVIIHIERTIRRLKGFTILSNIIPGRIQHVDDIVTICAGLCNCNLS